jgi:glycosyltransferase involved in cell wall biosynthesis
MRPAARTEIFTFGFRGFPGVQGGIEAHVEHLASRLSADGLPVTACFRTPYVGRECRADWRGVRLCRVWTVRNKYFEAILHSIMCAFVAGFRRPALVHIHGIGPALVTPLVRLFGLPVVVTHHGPDYDREKWGRAARALLRLGEAAGMRFANGRIAVSRNVQALVREKYDQDCAVIPNGVVVSALPDQKDRVEALGLDPGHYVLTVGRLVPEKRQLDLLRAFASVRPAGWKLVIVGQIDHANDYATQLVQEAERADGVVMAGFRTGEDLRQLFAHAGLFVLPSSHEGLPIALLEARSYGVPVLVSDIPANREVVDDDACVFRTGDVAELAKRIASSVTDARSMPNRETSRRENVRRYDWGRIARQTAAVYFEAVRTERPRRRKHRLARGI